MHEVYIIKHLFIHSFTTIGAVYNLICKRILGNVEVNQWVQGLNLLKVKCEICGI